MSNIIPIVSSSPPPMDDGAFDWEDNDDIGDDDDDDFGKFATAPSINIENTCEDFSPQWPEASTSPQSDHKPDSSPKLTDEKSQSDGETSDLHSNSNSNLNFICHSDGIINEPSTFPATMDKPDISDQETSEHPQCSDRKKDVSQDSDPIIETSHDQRSIDDHHQNSIAHSAGLTCSEVGDSVYSNASTTDSGMFSSDMMSPAHDDTVGGNGESLEVVPDTVHQQQVCKDHNEEDTNDWADFNSAVTSQVDTPSEILDAKSDDQVLEKIAKVDGRQSKDNTEIDNQDIRDSTNLPLSSQHLETNLEPSICDKADSSINSSVVGQSDLENSEDGWEPFNSTCENVDENEQQCHKLELSPNNLGNLTKSDDLQHVSDKDDDNVTVNGSDEACISDSERNLASTEDDEHEECANETAATQTVSSHIDEDDFGDFSSRGKTTADEGDTNKVTVNTDICDQSDDTISQDNISDDKEFGCFSTNQDKTTESQEEVAPISFRTSECEADEESESSSQLKQSAEIDDEDSEFKQAEHPSLEDNDESEEEDAFRASTDDFGDFDSMGKSGTNPDEEDFGDFGAFDEAAGGTEDSGWADFNAAPPGDSKVAQEPPEIVPANKTVINDQVNKSNKVEVAMHGIFPVETKVPSVHSEPEQKDTDSATETLNTVVELGLHSNVEEAKQQTWTVVQHPAKRDPSVRLWNHLRDVDSSTALVYAWPSSHCSGQVFSTLHIDTKNILFSQKKQAVPFIPSGILEPIRSEGKKTEKREVTTLLDTGYTPAPPTVTVQDIPPVDFDWSSSGLTNPLTVFKSDNEDSPKSSLQPLEDIMKHSTPTAKLTSQEFLSPEAMLILRKMPNLSFMQSRVLMFPIKQ